MTFHIINGDCSTATTNFGSLRGTIYICRERLIEGPLGGDTLYDFWESRARYFQTTLQLGALDYSNIVIPEFKRIINIPHDAEIYLWFKSDLSSQVNMWYTLSLIADFELPKSVFRIFPLQNNENLQPSFDQYDEGMLKQAIEKKIPFLNRDIELGISLWSSFKKGDLNRLLELSESESDCHLNLREAVLGNMETHE